MSIKYINGRDRSARSRAAQITTVSALALALLGGCQKKPGGQVVAVVDSEEITQQELRAEADAAGVPPGQELQTFAAAILDRVIERNLLAEYARKQGLDRGPEYLSRRRQLEQSLLATLALRKLAGPQTRPSPADVQAFIRGNPALFAGRQVLTLDQIRFPSPSSADVIRGLEKLGSLNAVEAKLKADGVKFARGVARMDTGTLESGVARQVMALPAGQVFDISTGGVTFLSIVTGQTPAATAPATWTQPASAALQREKFQKTLAAAMADLRKNATIQYDPAFKPAKAP
ncbi:peptidyl-prolyl cis-trans isomerase [uncultured Sphingomonas sp.]|uniref:peptidyl-prolyl cis-trans isomerase n=1 Tax=uncultured Sphingomonas sp. TaxID=158754 RepID=UPI0035C99010